MELERVTKHTPASAGKSSWHVLDADGKALGRLATSISMLLQGKHKADYSRHLPNGDFVIVINAARVGITGNKREQKPAQFGSVHFYQNTPGVTLRMG